MYHGNKVCKSPFIIIRLSNAVISSDDEILLQHTVYKSVTHLVLWVWSSPVLCQPGFEPHICKSQSLRQKPWRSADSHSAARWNFHLTKKQKTWCYTWVLAQITDPHRGDEVPVVGMLMPSFCQVMVGLGEPVAQQGSVMGLLRITSRVGGWDWITGSSGEKQEKVQCSEWWWKLNKTTAWKATK